MRLKATDLFLALLAIMLVGVSFWQTWLGLSQIFGGASLIIALVLSLLLLFLAFLIRSARLDGKSIGGLLGLYVFVAMFCFIANFNAIYTRFMKTEIYTTEIKSINDKFNELQSEVDNRLTYIVDKNTRQAIISDVNQLIIQINDPRNPGIGTRAKDIIQRIEKKIGKRVTLLTPRSKTQSGYEDLADRMAKQIITMMEVLSPDERKMRDDIDVSVLKWNKKTKQILAASPDVINSTAVGLINDAVLDYNKLGNNAENVLGHSRYAFEPIKSEAQDVGKIGYAFRHAFHNFGMYQFVVLLGCFLLDFMLVLVILLVTETNKNTKTSGGSIFKKQGKTLIN